jgi:hypothetical protein
MIQKGNQKRLFFRITCESPKRAGKKYRQSRSFISCACRNERWKWACCNERLVVNDASTVELKSGPKTIPLSHSHQPQATHVSGTGGKWCKQTIAHVFGCPRFASATSLRIAALGRRYRFVLFSITTLRKRIESPKVLLSGNIQSGL